MITNANEQPKIMEAAGGVLWKETSMGFKLAIIHRQRYDDWSLPKGKRKLGERWEETALREVLEETGCQATLGAFIGSTSYLVDAHISPKVVLFWQMHLLKEGQFVPNDEVDRLEWVHPQEALNTLDYPDERQIVVKALKQLKET
jgi:8-oxo-dGTP diphosphatase